MSMSMSIMLSSKVTKSISDLLESSMEEVVRRCASKYGFSAEEAMCMLGMEIVSDVGVGVGVEKKSKSKSKAKELKSNVSSVKSSFPLPYNGEFNEDTCFALKGELYTQCQLSRVEGGSFCKACQKKADMNESGKPDSGTIKDRQSVGIFEYVDSKGRKPSSYLKLMKKLNLSRLQVEEEAGKFNMKINEEHFVEEEVKVKGAKGRPKKTKKVIEIEGEEDLFANLVAQANASEVEVEVEDNSISAAKEEEVRVAKEEAKALAEQKKAEERAAKEEAKALAEQKKAEERAAKEEALRIAKEEAKALAEQKKLEERAAKESAKVLAEQKKEAERIAKEEAKALAEQKKIEERAAKEAERIAKEEAKALAEQKKAEDRAAKEASKATTEQKKDATKKKAQVEDDEADVVKKVEVDGKQYLKSKKTGIIYDYNEYKKNGEQVVIGQWNTNTNKIDFKSSGDEESEDEYDDDDN